MEDKAEILRADTSILEEADFNAFKTWVEYVNRLIGALIGIFIIITLINSFAYMKTDPVITLISFLGLVLVLFQGWIGSIVVSTNLVPWMVTVHMLIALVIVAMLIYAVARAISKAGSVDLMRVKSFGTYNIPLAWCIALVLIQIVMGTQVRETVDRVAIEFGDINRDQWIANLGFPFYFHRSFSIAVLLTNAWLFVRLYQSGNDLLYFWGRILVVMIGIEIFSGIIMAYFAVPRVAQPVHLLFGTTLFGIQFVIFLLVNHGWVFGKKQMLAPVTAS
jgi:cytochrome c oxidase assembly protein subunit 15